MSNTFTLYDRGTLTITGVTLADPDADRIVFWDDTAGTYAWLTAGTGLTITDTTIAVSGAGLTDVKVGIDSVATAGYLGAASSDGVLRVDSTLSYTDGGDFITLGVSSIDISANTNLAVTSPIVLTGDTLSHSAANGNIHLPVSGASTQLLQYASAGTAKWSTVSGDATIADGGAVTVVSMTVADTTDTTCFPALFETVTGTGLAPKTDAGLTYNAGTASLAATTFVGALTGNASGSSGSCTGNAATVTNATLTTALTVNTGTLTLTANVANSSVLTIGAGASSISGANTGDNAANSTYTIGSATQAWSAVLDTVTASTYTGDNAITTLGTISTGTWQSTDIGVAYGGTGVSTLTDGGLLVGAGAAAIEALAVGLTTQVLVGGGAGTNPAWGTDLPTALTIGGQYSYRVGGTDVSVADGGTGGSAASITLFNNITGFTAAGSTGTTSTNLVFSTSPTFITPVLGAASATSLATSAATPLLLTNGQLVNIALTSQTAGATTLTIPDFASVVDEFTFKTKAQTMSNKTFVAPVLGTPASGNLTNCTAYEGTAILSTGEAGGTKYLREDGDNTCSWQAISATNITVADTASATCWVGLWEAATGSQAPKSDAGLTYAATTGILTATGFAGPLVGNVTGNCSGSAGTVATITGLAPDTATTQATQASITTCSNLVTVGILSGGNATAVVDAASTTAAGKVEIAIASEVDTGTDATRAISPDSLAGSALGTKNVVVKCIADDTVLTTGDGKAHFTIPIELTGMNLVSVGAHVYGVSSSGTPTFQIHNLTDTTDMLSTLITIDANEKDSSTAATPAVINGAADDVVTGDEIRFDCDVAGTGADGMEIRMGFRLP